MNEGWAFLYGAYRRLPLYEFQKNLAIQLWMAEYGPLPHTYPGVCAVCAVRGYNAICKLPPDAHHLIIPRSYTRDRDRTVNWYWNLIPVDQSCHELAHSKDMKDRLVLEQARLIGLHILGDDTEIATQTGLAWIAGEILREGLRVPISLPQPNSTPK